MLKSTALGFLTGMRSLTPLAAWTRQVQRDSGLSDGSLVDAFQLPAVKWLTTLGAVGELVGDKMPFMPDRRGLFPMVGRIGIGSLIGASTSQASDQSPVLGGLLGGVAALAGTHAGYHVRRLIGTKVPQPFDGVLEDVLVVAGSLAATK